jgi:hypothetical protein
MKWEFKGDARRKKHFAKTHVPHSMLKQNWLDKDIVAILCSHKCLYERKKELCIVSA